MFEVSGGAGRCEADTEDMVSEVSVDAERCEADSKDTVFEASGIPWPLQRIFQAVFGDQVVSPGPVFLFHDNAVSFWNFSGNGIVEYGSLVAASCCSSLVTCIASFLLDLGMFWDFGSLR